MREEEIRSALDGTTRETLADALAIVLAEGNAPAASAAGMNKPELANFAEAVQFLKKQYDFAELDKFTTEADLVYVQAGDRRVLLTDRMNGVSRPMSSSSLSSGQAEAGTSSASSQKKEDKHQAPENEGGRFSHLELWE